MVGCRTKVDKAKLTPGTRVALDMTTLTIMRALQREVSRCLVYIILPMEGWSTVLGAGFTMMLRKILSRSDLGDKILKPSRRFLQVAAVSCKWWKGWSCQA